MVLDFKTFVNLLIHSLNKYILSATVIPGTMLCIRNNMVNKMDMVMANVELIIYDYIMLN